MTLADLRTSSLRKYPVTENLRFRDECKLDQIFLFQQQTALQRGYGNGDFFCGQEKIRPVFQAGGT